MLSYRSHLQFYTANVQLISDCKSATLLLKQLSVGLVSLLSVLVVGYSNSLDIHGQYDRSTVYVRRRLNKRTSKTANIAQM